MALWASPRALLDACRHLHGSRMPLQALQNTLRFSSATDQPLSGSTPSSKDQHSIDESGQRLLRSMLRANLTAEAASSRLFAGQSACRDTAADARLFKERGEALLERVKALAPQHRTRPSLLAPAARAAAFGLGVVSAYVPGMRATVGGAMQDAIVEQYNDQLRDLREAGLAEQLSDVRAMLRELRDEERAPQGSVKAPDVMRLQQIGNLSLEEGVAGVVKFGFKAIFSAAQRV